MDQLTFGFGRDDGTEEPVSFLTIAEAARDVRCCERTIRRAIDRGALRAGRIRAETGSRGGFRIRPADLEAWMYGDARKRREPTVEMRRHLCADGSLTDMWSVRFCDPSGARRRLACDSREQADFERARLVLAECRGDVVGAAGERAHASPG
jgi:excisionase family DNA binding protein